MGLKLTANFETAAALTALLSTFWPSLEAFQRIAIAVLWFVGSLMYIILKDEIELGTPEGTLPPRVRIAADFYLDTEEGQEHWSWEDYNAFWDQLETLPYWHQLWWTTLMTVDLSTKDALLRINPLNAKTSLNAVCMYCPHICLCRFAGPFTPLYALF
ncbi:hypothetical protein HDU90_005014 [Geranomyces variabilis]|nr:hypothetical protein HDU90_005014 [Geranomyces variabilis]